MRRVIENRTFKRQHDFQELGGLSTLTTMELILNITFKVCPLCSHGNHKWFRELRTLVKYFVEIDVLP